MSSLCEQIGFNQLSEAISTAHISGEFYRSMANGFRNNCFSEMVRMIVFPRKVVYPRAALFTLPHRYIYSFPLDSRWDFHYMLYSLYTSNVCVQNRNVQSVLFRHMSMHSPQLPKSFSNNCGFGSIDCFRLVNQKLSMWCLANEHSSMIFGPQISTSKEKKYSFYKVATA